MVDINSLNPGDPVIVRFSKVGHTLDHSNPKSYIECTASIVKTQPLTVSLYKIPKDASDWFNLTAHYAINLYQLVEPLIPYLKDTLKDLVNAWNSYIKYHNSIIHTNSINQDNLDDFRIGIHNLQRILFTEILREKDPDSFK